MFKQTWEWLRLVCVTGGSLETGAPTLPGLYQLYSEASLGKAYLRAMGVKPWQEVQRGFPLHLVGAIMSAYFNRSVAEVHIRINNHARSSIQTFLAMYPTVCAASGAVWSFVRAKGMSHHDDTNAVTALQRLCWLTPMLGFPNRGVLRSRGRWKDLRHAISGEIARGLFG